MLQRATAQRTVRFLAARVTVVRKLVGMPPVGSFGKLARVLLVWLVKVPKEQQLSYQSIDVLQRALATSVFTHSKDAKKAAGRALGTIVETITFFVLRSWGLLPSVAIEQKLSEYGNPEITHNVEFSLHPLLGEKQFSFVPLEDVPSVTVNRLLKALPGAGSVFHGLDLRTETILDTARIQRNCAVVGRDAKGNLGTVQLDLDAKARILRVQRLWSSPYAMIECKRVGVEEGQKKGPTTIEKAKQGAYVAARVSALQKVVDQEGNLLGVRFRPDGTMDVGPYQVALDSVVKEGSLEDLEGLVLTVGVVSNHGNWFTNSTLNKELKVLRQSYDWLIFLKDQALAEFISDTILSTERTYAPIRSAFMSAYSSDRKGRNAFTKVTMNEDAFASMVDYFDKKKEQIERDWFEMLSSGRTSIAELREELQVLDARVRELHHDRERP